MHFEQPAIIEADGKCYRVNLSVWYDLDFFANESSLGMDSINVELVTKGLFVEFENITSDAELPARGSHIRFLDVPYRSTDSTESDGGIHKQSENSERSSTVT